MKKPMWFYSLCTKRYNQRQQEILREIAELQHRRNPVIWPREEKPGPGEQ